MPNLKNAYKALRQSKKRAERNLVLSSDLRTLLKKTRKAIDGKATDAQTMMKEAQIQIDKAAKIGIIKKNTAARKLSRLMAYYHKGGKNAQKAEETK